MQLTQKEADIDVAARAEFESTKAVIEQLDGVEWEEMPDSTQASHLGYGKDYYRELVRAGVEALWRTGRLTEARDGR